MVQFLSIIFFLDFFNFCWVFQKFQFFCVTCTTSFFLFVRLWLLSDRSPCQQHNFDFDEGLKTIFRVCCGCL